MWRYPCLCRADSPSWSCLAHPPDAISFSARWDDMGWCGAAGANILCQWSSSAGKNLEHGVNCAIRLETGMGSVSFDKMGLRNGQEENFNNQDYVLSDYKVKLVCASSHQHFMTCCSIMSALLIKILSYFLWARKLKWKYQLNCPVSDLE